jgi:hypothetical protein
MATPHWSFGLMSLVLAVASGCGSAAPLPQAPEVPVVGCSTPYPLENADEAVVIEGFGGRGDEQLIVTRRQPGHRCAVTVVQARDARMSALP